MRGPAPLARQYELVLTDTYWDLGPGPGAPSAVVGSPEWRIETFESEPWITIDTAIRYLTGLRAESKSETVKNNAERSIAALRRLR